jgi:hypothetical protein
MITAETLRCGERTRGRDGTGDTETQRTKGEKGRGSGGWTSETQRAGDDELAIIATMEARPIGAGSE